jgi:hypothetical protein
MRSVPNKPFTLSAIMLTVVILRKEDAGKSSSNVSPVVMQAAEKARSYTEQMLRTMMI